MTVNEGLRGIAGAFVLISVALGVWVNPWFFAFTAFVGLNLLQSAFTVAVRTRGPAIIRARCCRLLLGVAPAREVTWRRIRSTRGSMKRHASRTTISATPATRRIHLTGPVASGR